MESGGGYPYGKQQGRKSHFQYNLNDEDDKLGVGMGNDLNGSDSLWAHGHVDLELGRKMAHGEGGVDGLSGVDGAMNDGELDMGHGAMGHEVDHVEAMDEDSKAHDQKAYGGCEV